MNIWKKAEKDIIIHKNKLNIIASCIDRHAKNTPNKLALIINKKKYTYKKLQEEVNKFSNYLKLKNNSRVFIFLPKVPELYISFLSIIQQGAIAIPLFEAFQTDGLELRLKKGDANVLITNKQLKKRLKQKIKGLKVITIDKIKSKNKKFKTVLKNKYDTALMIFTSSTAGTPVAGIQIPHYGLVQQHFTAKLVLDLKPNDHYWCTAHPGWVTGSIYGIIAPLSIGCTNYILTEHFNSKKWIDFIKNNKISVIYTAPTALRLLKPDIKNSDLKIVRNLCSVGEALTKTTFDHYKKLGITINDTYWQTETGAIVIANWPKLKKKPGSIGKPIGVKAKIKNKTITLKPKWPSMMTGVYKHPKMYKSYFKNGWFLTKDLAKKDKDNYFFFEAREDDIIKSSGERISPIEIESVLMKHKAVKEVAVIGVPDQIKGHILKAFIILNKNIIPSEKLKEELSLFVKNNYAGHSYPKIIQFVKNLPKTNSGKIIRMKLREINHSK